MLPKMFICYEGPVSRGDNLGLEYPILYPQHRHRMSRLREAKGLS